MAKKGTATHLVVVLDRSGSMGDIRDATIEGMNSFLREQKEAPGKLTCTIQLFDTVDLVYPAKNLPISEVLPFTRETYVPRGGTPLYDAVGKEIAATEEYTRGKDVAVLFVVMTDGQENSSHTFTRQQLFDLVNRKQAEDSWRFVFLGANQDAYAEGAKQGYSAGYTSNFTASPAGVRAAFLSVGANMTSYRSVVEDFGAVGAAAATPDFFTQAAPRPDTLEIKEENLKDLIAAEKKRKSVKFRG